MRAGWIGYVVFVWLVVLILSSVAAGVSFTDDEDVMGTLDTTSSFVEVWTEEDWGTLVNPMNFPEYFADIWRMATLEDSFLANSEDSGLMLIYALVVMPIVVTIVFALVILFVSILQRVL